MEVVKVLQWRGQHFANEWYPRLRLSKGEVPFTATTVEIANRGFGFCKCVIAHGRKGRDVFVDESGKSGRFMWGSPTKLLECGKGGVEMQAGRSKSKPGRDSGGRIEKGYSPPRREGQKGGHDSQSREKGTDDSLVGKSGELQRETKKRPNPGVRSDQRKEPSSLNNLLLKKSDLREGKRKGKDRSNNSEERNAALLYDRDNPLYEPRFPPDIDESEENKPPEYYTLGPYGPYAWKGVPLGKPAEGNIAGDQVSFWSNVKSEKEAQDREMVKCMLAYDEQVEALQEEGCKMQFFFAFARKKPRRETEESWKDWTLVAQIAVEAETVLDPKLLFLKLSKMMKDVVTKCVAWARPDLVFVAKPGYELTLEPQTAYLDGLCDILDPKTHNGQISYFEQLCGIIGVNVNDELEDIVTAYEGLNDKVKLMCWEHLMSSLPVRLLTPYSQRRTQEGAPKIDGAALGVDEVDDELNGTDIEGEEGSEVMQQTDEDEDQLVIEMDDVMDEMEKDFEREMRALSQVSRQKDRSGGTREFESTDPDEEESLLDDDQETQSMSEIDHIRELYSSEEAAVSQSDEDTEDDQIFELQSAVRPFTNVNLFREIVFIRQLLVEDKMC